MSQNPKHVLDHFNLFREPEYVEMFENKKKNFENPHPEDEVSRIIEWTKTEEYKELNFNRDSLTVNPAKACQPLGAVFLALGFENTLPSFMDPRVAWAYYRSHLSRHFKEPTSCVSSSMTEDAAVFGGLNNMIDGLANAYGMYKPKMIAVSTTCMAEVIGDDLNAFIKTSKDKGSVPEEYDVPFAHTPAFVGSHITGYDNALKGIMEHFWAKKERQENETINIVMGFDGYSVGNIRELKRVLKEMDINAIILSDTSDVFDTPTDGTFRMYMGGTPLEAAREALNSKATISFQEFNTPKSLEYAQSLGQKTMAFHYPIGIRATDRWILSISKLTGKEIPESIKLERGRLVDAVADSTSHIHGKKFALYGDPDQMLGLSEFLMELGAEPVHVLATNGGKDWEEKMNALFATSPFGAGCHAYPGRDLWHMRSLLFTEPVDFLIGNTYGKYLERDTGTPLLRIGFPIFDRHHHHRYPTVGYQGAMNVLVKILDKIFDEIDKNTNVPSKTDYSYDIIR
uniref:Nitrogenase molybdenum-iron protein beta chain n=4 Tax=root TaxID=1 RepID=H9C4W0_9BACT|nr:NifK [Leptospirillum ferrooxidans]